LGGGANRYAPGAIFATKPARRLRRSPLSIAPSAIPGINATNCPTDIVWVSLSINSSKMRISADGLLEALWWQLGQKLSGQRELC